MYTKLIKSGNIIEIYDYEKTPAPQKGIKRKARPRSEVDHRVIRAFKYRRGDNLRGLRKTFLRLVRSNLVGEERPLLLTLTYYEVVPLRGGYTDLTVYTRRLRRAFGKDFRYIAVPEFQKRGSIHFHLLLWGLPSELKNERHTRYLQILWGKGFVDLKETDGSPKLAGYLAKYMFKAMQDPRLSGEKAFSASRNVLRPVSIPFDSFYVFSRDLFGYTIEDCQCLQDFHFPTKWLGTGRFRMFKEKKL